MGRLIGRYVSVALLVAGSAILLFACDKPAVTASGGNEALMTEYSEQLSVIMSENGRRSYFFKAPQLEGYTLSKEPYREFRKGIEITTYQDDSLTTVDAVLTANYAIYYENRKLWEAKGDVVVVKSDGKTLYTQQLFWNAKTQRIYSNVDTKIVQNEGGNVFQGEGFESDEAFKEWRFRRFTGKMDVDVSQDDDETAEGDDRPIEEGPSAGRKMPQSAVRPSAGVARPAAADAAATVAPIAATEREAVAGNPENPSVGAARRVALTGRKERAVSGSRPIAEPAFAAGGESSGTDGLAATNKTQTEPTP